MVAVPLSVTGVYLSAVRNSLTAFGDPVLLPGPDHRVFVRIVSIFIIVDE
jgi:hypothetical protein